VETCIYDFLTCCIDMRQSRVHLFRYCVSFAINYMIIYPDLLLSKLGMLWGAWKVVFLWNGMAQNHKDRFWWYLAEI